MVDSGGTLLYVERLDETFQNAANISIGKARTAVLFGKPTRVFEDLVNKGRYTMLALPEIAAFTPLMGGVPHRNRRARDRRHRCERCIERRAGR